MKNKKYLSLALACCLLGSIALAQEKKEMYDANYIADIFYKLNSDPQDPKRKINHTKGFCASGTFEPTANITNAVDIPLLKQRSIPVEVRYSLGGASMMIRAKLEVWQ